MPRQTRSVSKKSPRVRKGSRKRTKKPRSPVSYKISKLVREGVPHKQAVAMALSMHDAGRLGPRGGYIRAIRRRRSKVGNTVGDSKKKMRHKGNKKMSRKVGGIKRDRPKSSRVPRRTVTR